MVELEVHIKARDLYDFMLMHNYSQASGVFGSTVGALMIVSGIYMKYWLLLIAGVVVLLYLPWVLFVKSAQQATNPMFQEPLRYVLDEQGITVSQGEMTSSQSWEEMRRVVSTTKSIIIYTSPVNAMIFPKRQMNDKKSLVIEIISTHMPPDKVRIKE